MKTKIKKTVAFLALLSGLSTMEYAWGQITKTEQIYHDGSAAYEALSNQVRAYTADGSAAPRPGMETQPVGTGGSSVATEKTYIPELDIDFDALRTVNDEAVAWLYCPDTVIDYPVMKADDYSYYLSHLPDGAQNANGSLFIDYNCAPDFEDPLTVVYGHNMKSKMMFGSLVDYKSQTYYNEHPYMYLYTPQGDHRIELLYGCVIGAGQWRERAFMYKENVEALIAYAEHNTTFESDAVYAEGDRVIAMSTCSYEFEDARYVVIGIIKGTELN